MQTRIHVFVLALVGSSLAQAEPCVPNNPVAAYQVDAEQGVVTDLRTGLMWKRCLEGQNGQDCAGTAQALDWAGASARVATVNRQGFAGHTDWRLPDIQELQQLVELCLASPLAAPATHPVAFPGAVPVPVWSGTPHAQDEGQNAWSVDFATGSSYFKNRTSNKYVWLVRTGQ